MIVSSYTSVMLPPRLFDRSTANAAVPLVIARMEGKGSDRTLFAAPGGGLISESNWRAVGWTTGVASMSAPRTGGRSDRCSPDVRSGRHVDQGTKLSCFHS